MQLNNENISFALSSFSFFFSFSVCLSLGNPGNLSILWLIVYFILLSKLYWVLTMIFVTFILRIFYADMNFEKNFQTDMYTILFAYIYNIKRKILITTRWAMVNGKVYDKHEKVYRKKNIWAILFSFYIVVFQSCFTRFLICMIVFQYLDFVS